MGWNKAIKAEVFNKCRGRCAYCGINLDHEWQVDHAISRFYWFFYTGEDKPSVVNHIDNLLPACKVCNHYKRDKIVGASSKNSFRHFMDSFHIRLARYPKNPRTEKGRKRKEYMYSIADRYGITVDKAFCGVFYFETLDR